MSAHSGASLVLVVVSRSRCVSASLDLNRVAALDGPKSIGRALRACPGSLQHLHGVNLRHLDPSVPPELTGNQAILDFYRDMGPAVVVVRRCRVLLLGPGGAGKTTLAHRLVTGSALDRADVTHGVVQSANGSFNANASTASMCMSLVKDA
jgi:hypothetical protein